MVYHNKIAKGSMEVTTHFHGANQAEYMDRAFKKSANQAYA